MKKDIYFRADGNTKIGLGHVVRSLSLVEMLSPRFNCHFLISCPTTDIKQLVLATCESLVELKLYENLDSEADYIVQYVLKERAIIVLDGYHFNASYQQRIRAKENILVCIDDICDRHFFADVIINHGAGIKSSEYSAQPYTKFYLGIKYALLRKPFREVSRKKLKRERNNNLFVCFGGADPQNTTLKVLRKIESTNNDYFLFIILGAANKFKKEILHFLNQSQIKFQVLSNLSADEMLNCMKNCSIAITPPSSVSYEYLNVGGELYLELIAENQRRMLDYFISEKLAFRFEDFPFTSFKQVDFEKLLENQRSMFDGQQQERFLKIFESL